jgi:hypothetical protein
MVGLTIDPTITDKLIVAGFSLFRSSGTDYQIYKNVIKGIKGIGFLYKGYDCGDTAQKQLYTNSIYGNEAGSNSIGFLTQKNSTQCLGIYDFKGKNINYKFK